LNISRKIIKALREFPIEVGRFLGGKYPKFITDSACHELGNEVPVFMFHTVDPPVFESQLDYLKQNQYNTLTLEQFMAFLDGSETPEGSSVLLTFDDGDKSWKQTAWPLLEKYGFHAAGFIVPCFIRESRDEETAGHWLSWTELSEMDRSGVFDIQSHSCYHDRIFISPELKDFFSPDFSHNPLGMDTPWINEGTLYTNTLKWGTPVYHSASRFDVRPRYFDDEYVRNLCISWVESQGAEAFFSQRHWRRKLKDFYRKHQTAGSSRYETIYEQRAAMLDSLTRSREIIESRLDKSVKHLCYPWGTGSDLSVSMSREAGYISNFWTALDRDRRTNRRGDSPFYISRIKDDYIFRLPGKGRKSLLDIFRTKLARRATKSYIY